MKWTHFIWYQLISLVNQYRNKFMRMMMSMAVLRIDTVVSYYCAKKKQLSNENCGVIMLNWFHNRSAFWNQIFKQSADRTHTHTLYMYIHIQIVNNDLLLCQSSHLNDLYEITVLKTSTVNTMLCLNRCILTEAWINTILPFN